MEFGGFLAGSLSLDDTVPADGLVNLRRDQEFEKRAPWRYDE